MFADEVIMKLSDYYALSREDVEYHQEAVLRAFMMAADKAESAENGEFGQIDGNDLIYEEIMKLRSPKLAFQFYGQIIALMEGVK